MLERFRGFRNFSDRYSSWMQHMTKEILSTKITKGSDIFDYKLRALRVLRGQICFFFFGYDSAARDSMRLKGAGSA
jgi:hypothetical protein